MSEQQRITSRAVRKRARRTRLEQILLRVGSSTLFGEESPLNLRKSPLKKGMRLFIRLLFQLGGQEISCKLLASIP